MEGKEVVDLAGGKRAWEVGALWENLDVDGAISRVHDDSNLHEAVGWATDPVGGTSWCVGVEGRLATLLTWGEDLDDVELAASRVPAGAGRLAVLKSTWDLGVQHPDGWHVAVEAVVSIVWHVELEHEDLVSAIESVVGNGAWANVATVAVGALAISEDGELVVRLDQGVLEDGWGAGATSAISVEVGKRHAVVVVEDTGALATVVAEEGQSIGDAGGSIVEADASIGGVWINGLGGLDLWCHSLGDIGVDNVSVNWAVIGSWWSLSSWCSGWSSGGSWLSEPVVLPGDNLAVDGGGNPVSALLVELLVSSVSACMWSTVDLALLTTTSLGVGSDLLEVHWSTEVKGDLLVERSEGARVWVWLGLASTSGHLGNLIVRSRMADVGVLEGLDLLAVVVTTGELRTTTALVGNGSTGAEGEDCGGDSGGELHFCDDVLVIKSRVKVSFFVDRRRVDLVLSIACLTRNCPIDRNECVDRKNTEQKGAL